MMKRSMIQKILACGLLCAVMALCAALPAMAYDANMAEEWLGQFAQALTALSPVNDPVLTADPARAGQYLHEYEFGTVLSGKSTQAKDILEIDVRTSQVTDCRGVRVGMALAAALEESATPQHTGAPLYVLHTDEGALSWSWAYLSDTGVYGVEYIAYGGEAADMKEYTLTYVIENDMISAIRMKIADALPAQALDGVNTAKEIASRQESEMLIARNDRPALMWNDLKIEGASALGVPVADLIGSLGEPASVQTLPQGNGRVLVYDGATVTLQFNEATGEELVRNVGVSNHAYEGPNGLKVGMAIRDAGALFRCDQGIYGRGGTLYLEGEAESEPPYGTLIVLENGEMLLSYACAASDGEAAVLQVGVSAGLVTYWQMTYESDMQGGV